MMVQAKLASIKGIALKEWAVRLLFGVAVCVAAGLIARRFGPGVAGLFLAFPAIFPAGARWWKRTKKSTRPAQDSTEPIVGELSLAWMPRGAVLGSVGLVGFALTCWICLPPLSAAATFPLAVLVWLALSITLWLLSKSRTFRRMRGGKTTLRAFRDW